MTTYKEFPKMKPEDFVYTNKAKKKMIKAKGNRYIKTIIKKVK